MDSRRWRGRARGNARGSGARASRRTLGREAMTSPRPPVLLKGAHSAPTMTTLRRSPSARTTTEARSREAGRGASGRPRGFRGGTSAARRTTPRVARRGRGRRERPWRGVRGAVSDVSEPLEPPRVSSRTRKIKKTAVDGLGEPLSARQVGRTRNLLGTPQIRNPLEAGRTKSRFCLRPFARRNTVAPRCELTRTFDPPRSRARPSRARADPCRCAARVSGPTSAPAARAFFPNAPRCVVRSARPAECFFRPRG